MKGKKDKSLVNDAKPNKKAKTTPMSARENAEQVVAMHRGPQISQRALSAVLGRIQGFGMPNAFSDRTQRRALERLGTEQTPYGPIVQDFVIPLKADGSKTIATQAPGAMLFATVRQCAPFRAFMRAMLAQHPSTLSSKWSLVIYFDGVTPTDGLSTKVDKRGVEIFYWSFLEFGRHLCFEELWFECTVARGFIVHRDMDGGMSHFVRIILERLFFNPDGVDISRHGVTMDFSANGDSSDLHTVFAEHRITCADLKALCEVLMSKGQGGTKPCPICRDMVHSTTNYAAHDESGRLAPMTDLNTSDRRVHTDESVKALLRRLGTIWDSVQTGETDIKVLNEKTQLNGYSYHPQCLALSERINYGVISTLRFDWMHVWAVDGIFPREVKILTRTIQQRKPRGEEALVTASNLHEYFQRWRWPRAYRGAANAFEGGKFAANASECLSAAPVLEMYFRDVVQPTGLFAAEVASFLLCCKAFMLHQSVSRGHATAGDLKEAVLKFLRQHLDTYGTRTWVFKHHMSTHLWRMVDFLLGCWTHERKHRVAKRFVKNVHYDVSYERTLMLNLTLQHISDLKHFSIDVGLIDKKPGDADLLASVRDQQLPAVERVFSSVQAKLVSFTLSRGDVVLLGAEHGYAAGDVWRFIECEPACGGPFAAMVIHPILAVGAARLSCKYELANNAEPILVRMSQIKCAALASRLNANSLTAIWPVEYKSDYELGV